MSIRINTHWFANGNTLTDLETSITTAIEVLADDDFTVAIPAKILLETLKALPQQPALLGGIL